MAAFLLLWGYPFLLQDQKLSPNAAGALLTTVTVVSLACNPLFGWIAGRWPHRRWWMILGIVGSTARRVDGRAALARPSPLWLLVLLMAVLATNGPGSVIGFDFARSHNPGRTPRRGHRDRQRRRVHGHGRPARASIGVGLDLHGDFRWALAVQYPILGAGRVPGACACVSGPS